MKTSASNQLDESNLREDQISTRRFNQLAQFIYDYCGIKMPPTKRTMLEGRLRRRLRETGIPSFEEYCRYLFDEDGLDQETIHLIDAVTTNKTDFFREPNHFEFLRNSVLPEIVGRGVRRIRIWSSACSNGAEPYTLAMVLQDFLETRRDVDYSILATDISTDVLAAAHRGVFTDDVIAPVPPEMRRKYVRSARKPGSREVRIAPALRSHVGFARLNLMDRKYQVGEPMDAIFCRNVLIYFDKETQAGVLERLCACLKPGGYMFIGHSETLTGVSLPLEAVAHTVFRKI